MKHIFYIVLCFMALLLTPSARSENSTIARLAADLSADDTMTIEIAAEQLVALGQPAIPTLLEALKSDHRDRKAAAMEALAALGATQATEPILDLFGKLGPVPKDTDTFSEGYLRHVAIRCLGRLGQPSAIPALQEAAKSPNLYDQTAAIIGLAMAKQPQALDKLIQLANAPNDDIRNMAVQGFALVRDPRTVPVLEAKLSDPRWYVRDNAVEALAAIGDAAAVQALKKAAEDSNPFVQRTAKEALAKL